MCQEKKNEMKEEISRGRHVRHVNEKEGTIKRAARVCEWGSNSPQRSSDRRIRKEVMRSEMNVVVVVVVGGSECR